MSIYLQIVCDCSHTTKKQGTIVVAVTVWPKMLATWPFMKKSNVPGTTSLLFTILTLWARSLMRQYLQ